MRDEGAAAMNHPTASVRPRRSRAILAVLLGLVSLWAIVAGSVFSARGQRADNEAMDAVYARSEVVTDLLSYLGYLSIGSAVVALLVLVGLSFASGGQRTALGVVAFVAGANVTTQVLKALIDRPQHFDALENSLPSGHTTLVLSLVLAALVVVPRALRYPGVLIATFLATATGASTVVAGWHRPSDVFAALAICLLWTGLVSLLVSWQLDYGPLATAICSLSGAMIAGLLLIAIGVRPQGGWPGFVDAALVLSAMGGATALIVTVFTRVIAPSAPR